MERNSGYYVGMNERHSMDPILIVDDERSAGRLLEIGLADVGVDDVVRCEDSRRVLPTLSGRPFSVVTLDLSMPHVSGRELLAEIVARWPELPVIVVTAAADVDTAVECMRVGAFDYVTKSSPQKELVARILKALKQSELRRESDGLRRTILREGPERPESFAAIATVNPTMINVFKYVECVAPTNFTLLITGETGVGKELIAESVHKASERTGEYVPVNVAGLDDAMFSDTLFGHVKGAYSGAGQTRAGLIERAADGTLFLDEIGDLKPESQVKLLRLLQDGSYLPLGSDAPKTSSARIVTATNRDLDAARRENLFRDDLFYRLESHRVTIPPLRERMDDLPVLIERFIAGAVKETGKSMPNIAAELIDLLGDYSFPGNVRELRGMIYDLVGRGGSASDLEAIRHKVGARPGDKTAEGPVSDSPKTTTFPAKLPSLKDVGDLLTDEALRRCDGNRSQAARMLGVTRQALQNRLKRRGDRAV